MLYTYLKKSQSADSDKINVLVNIAEVDGHKFPVLHSMSVILCLLFLAASTSGAILAPQQLEHFFDGVLEEGRHLVTVTTKLPGYDLDPGYFDLSFNWNEVSIRGPTTLKREGASSGVQTAEQAHAEAMVTLGLIDVYVKQLTFHFFGHSFSTDLHFSILDAKAPVTIDVFRNNLATCQVSVNVLRPIGNYVIHTGSQGAPAFVSALFNYVISFVFQLIRIDPAFIMDRLFIPNFTSHINRELTIAARRVAC